MALPVLRSRTEVEPFRFRAVRPFLSYPAMFFRPGCDTRIRSLFPRLLTICGGPGGIPGPLPSLWAIFYGPARLGCAARRFAVTTHLNPRCRPCSARSPAPLAEAAMALEQALSVARLEASPSPAPPLVLFASRNTGKCTLLRALMRHGRVPSASRPRRSSPATWATATEIRHGTVTAAVLAMIEPAAGAKPRPAPGRPIIRAAKWTATENAVDGLPDARRPPSDAAGTSRRRAA
jgi:hypothetical protein